MAISKIILNGITQMDVTQDTVASGNLLSGATATGADGQTVTGGIATKTSSDLTVSGATVTAPAGYYSSAASKTIPNADVSVSYGNTGFITESNVRKWKLEVNGYAESGGWVNNGEIDSDIFKCNAVASGTTITPSTSSQTVGGYQYMMEGAVTVSAMPSGTAGTPTATKGTVSNHSVTVTPSVTNSAGYISGGTKTGTGVSVSASELVSGNLAITENGTNIDVTNYATVSVAVEGGGSGVQTDNVGVSVETPSSSITFTGLKGEPTSFIIIPDSNSLSTASPPNVIALVFDGTTIHGQTASTTSNANASYDTGFTKSYSNGTLTITATTARFIAEWWACEYTYGGSSANIDTKDVQVGSGATSITFTGLDDEPILWSCIFKSNFGTSSGYQRVMFVRDNRNTVWGYCLDSSVHGSSAYWTASYSNGSLTITSSGTNAGGYFHQPGYYQLTAVYGGEIEPTEIEVEPLSVTQNGTYTAPTGKAYSPVTVNVSGGSVSVGQTTWSNNSTSTVSHQFTGLSGTPKFAVLRCTAQLTRSSSNTYYYIADIIWDGTNAWGNYHLRSNGTFNDVAKDAASGFNVSVGTNSITFSSDASSRSAAPGSFYNGTYELTYVY